MVYQVKPVPQGAWDTHHHIFEPDRFPFSAGRHFTPSVATLEDLQQFEASIGVAHVCIAHGLSYGPDCTSLLHYLEQLQGTARGICVIDERNVTDDLLEKYHAAGVRSVRLDFFKAQAMHDLQKQIDLIKAAAERLLRWKPDGNGWSIQIQQPIMSHWKEIGQVVSGLGLPVVVDHMGLVKAASMTPNGDPLAISQPGWQHLLKAMADGNIWVKISAPYRNSRNDPAYDDLEQIVTQLVRANPKRVVWGSDWPHTQRHEDRHLRGREEVEPFLKIDNKKWIEKLSMWLSEAEWNDLWVNNPRKLYDCAA
ncbi:hypothetical protein BHE90_014485 [Fusarium euwallaceae]|uniref:Amidohydrolase-related domain-containing protein n=5 Tax=Fusarium solani species complex TaxID=232080 RepID=A0A3M2REK4_9HYPO|nr:hypothetical protein CDV36_014795 [Fusarium kuroshium]RSL57098.1 hypothetical protein CEP51_014293 [Fusarium floridanum]RSL84367.1 hypothetical protein CEP52_016463 [Fusarium oligoseptatum]RSL88110.1 hypothetical protein CDV31_016141 [Fusarium ambrosium]RTE71101.1 hypothetical protein BHE90_014485 [Fusarium euwallaceae]